LKKSFRGIESGNGIAKQEEFEDPELNGLNILLVEDNVLNQVLAKKVLTDWRWNVDVAENGLVAIQKLNEHDFDLVLMDIQLPEMDGYEATRHIRKKMAPAKTNIPIIAMTAHAIAGEAEKCMNAGMNEYVSKPFDPKDLYHKVAHVLNNPPHLPEKGGNSKTNGKMQETKESTAAKDKNIDLSYLKQLSNGSSEFINQMITIFLEQTPKAIQTMEQAVEKGDWMALRAAAHKMKPSFGFMGIKSLKELIVQLEAEAEKGSNPEGMKDKIATIKTVCEQAIQELEVEQKTLS